MLTYIVVNGLRVVDTASALGCNDGLALKIQRKFALTLFMVNHGQRRIAFACLGVEVAVRLLVESHGLKKELQAKLIVVLGQAQLARLKGLFCEKALQIVG